ncbi:MAG: peroxiredoxin family protein, partial [Candidatus Binataceae bacterium]
MLCFVKEDCPTCGLSMPLMEQAYQAFGSALDIVVIGQEREGNQTLVERHHLTIPMLDDSALAVSFARNIEIVPTV